ncbi:MAG: NAD-dependent deacylase [Saprospiraceae bacterium]|nr:NAD-dependent deacylase [Saprospiraceae bacterium]
MNPKLVVLSGAGISAESGIKTFRDAGGLWEGFDVMDVASISGWNNNPGLVLDFYNQRRRQLLQCNPNKAHFILKDFENFFDVCIVTQNVDDLHERAGNKQIIHLHGELLKSQSTIDPTLIYTCTKDILPGDLCEKASQLRPYIVWFGEEVPLISLAAQKVSEAELVIVVGTSLQVYPAAGLISFAKKYTPIYYIDPKPSLNFEISRQQNLEIIPEIASVGLSMLYPRLTQLI